MPGLAGVVAIAVGNTHHLALTGDGGVLEWGWALGCRGPDHAWLSPQRVDLPAPARAIAAGRDHALVLTVDRRVLAWGDNALRRLSIDAGADPTRPTAVIGLNGARVVAIAAGWGSSFALTDAGEVFAWGWNHEGALGDGTLTDRTTPVQTTCPRETRAVAPRVALTRDGQVVQWGGRLPKRKRNSEARLALGASKVGGHPDLPPETAWPHSDGRPLAFVAQIRLDDLPRLNDDLLPASGLLSFFCAPIALGERDAGRVLYIHTGTPLVRAKAPAELEADERFAPAPLTATVELGAPSAQSELLDDLGLSYEQRCAYDEALEPDIDTPMHRMLGHPNAIQDDPSAGRPAARLLLQVDSDEAIGMMWGDVGRLYYLISPGDLADCRFDRCHLHFQCY